MGGHAGGAIAAQMIVDRLPLLLENAPASASVLHALEQAIQSLNREIQAAQQDRGLPQMGSTLVLALCHNRSLWIAHVGDSRLYLFRRGALRQLTRDHTVVQRLVDEHAISRDAARSHPQHSVLTRVVGQPGEVAPDVHGPYELQGGDGLLLCSDGLAGFVGDDAIEGALVRGGDPDSLAAVLEEMALASGSTDNITVRYIEILGDPPPLRQAQPHWRIWLGVGLVVFLFATATALWWDSGKGAPDSPGVRQELPVSP
jgi:protein phosphatase